MDKIKEWFAKDLKVKLIVLLGLVGMLLILFSQMLSDRGEEETQLLPDTTTAQFTSEEYIESLEAKLLSVVSEIDGVGRAQVMVTLETGVEYVYVVEEKRELDRVTDPSGEQQAALITENVEQTYLMVDGENGKEPLVRTELQPRVQGVVIVCEGADDARVEQSLVSVVTTALGIPSTRVCVVKIS